MQQRMSALALNRLTKPWEEFVAYPYDDKVPKRRDPQTGKRAYPEWQGGAVRGTITQGFGHTDAAGDPKIVVGSHWSEDYATRVLAADIAPCEAAVRRLITVPLGQHQFDTLTDFVFNAGAGTLQKSTLRRKLNAGDYDCVPAELMKFTLSKGEHMEGLVHRRQAEISIWRLPDEASAAVRQATPLAPADQGVAAEDVICPKAELPAARSALDSKSVAAATTSVVTGGAMVAKGIDAANQAAEPIKQVQGNLQDLGLWNHIVAVATGHPLIVAGVIVAALAGFLLFDRWRHLHQETR